MYADVERALVAWLPSRAGARALTDLPVDLQQVVPVIQVTRWGGADEVLTLDRASVDIDCFAATRAGAIGLAEQVRALLRIDLPGTVVAGGVIARVQTLTAPGWRPVDNPAVRRIGATYVITVHARR